MTIIEALKGVARALFERVESERKARERAAYDRALKWRQVMTPCDARDYLEMRRQETWRMYGIAPAYRIDLKRDAL